MNQAIFWDFDGTLVQSGPLWSRSVLYALREEMKDCSITLEDIRPLMRTGFPWHHPERDFTEIIGEKWWQYMFRRFTDVYLRLGIDETIAVAASKQVRQIILQTQNYCVYEDTMDTLGRCRDLGYDNYLLSNNYPELDSILEQLNLADYFQGTIISGKIGYDKPRVEIFQYALKTAHNPDQCFMIGDNPIADIEGARRLGIPSLLVHNKIVCPADYTVDNLRDVMDILSSDTLMGYNRLGDALA